MCTSVQEFGEAIRPARLPGFPLMLVPIVFTPLFGWVSVVLGVSLCPASLLVFRVLSGVVFSVLYFVVV